MSVARRLGLGGLALALAGCSARDDETQLDAWEARAAAARADSQTQQARAPTPADTSVEGRKQACIDSLLPVEDDALATLYRALCSEWVEQDIPGVALLIVGPERAPIHVELGVRCFGEPGAVTVNTPFRLGSLSKTFTAALALGLVDAGELDRDTPATIVEGYEDQAGLPTPTLATLLRHRSGLGEIEPAQLVAHDGAWLPALARSPTAGAAGNFHYANSGYVLVGAMIEARGLKSYEQQLRERVGAPLGLAELTTVPQRVEGAACGHLAHDRDRHPIAVSEDLDFMPGDPSWLNPAGGVLASSAQLARFALFLGRPDPPGTAAMLELGEPVPTREGRPPRRDERYGDGLRSWELPDGTRAYGHSGNNVAFASELMFVPGRRAIVVLSNCGVAMPATYAAAERLL